MHLFSISKYLFMYTMDYMYVNEKIYINRIRIKRGS